MCVLLSLNQKQGPRSNPESRRSRLYEYYRKRHLFSVVTPAFIFCLPQAPGGRGNRHPSHVTARDRNTAFGNDVPVVPQRTGFPAAIFISAKFSCLTPDGLISYHVGCAISLYLRGTDAAISSVVIPHY